MAVLDVVVNNADRKGGHVLPLPSGQVRGVDHGVSFHVEPKLRTVLWGWAGEPLADEETRGADSADRASSTAISATRLCGAADPRRGARDRGAGSTGCSRRGRLPLPRRGLAVDPVAAVLSRGAG